MKKILIFNTGSSTIKYKMYELENNKLTEISSASVGRIGLPNGPKTHVHALSILFKGIGMSIKGLSGIENLSAIGHRVVHCGDYYDGTTRIDNQVINKLKEYNQLAPLHNPHILEVIKDVYANSKSLEHRTINNYAVFDSLFFKDIPLKAKLYPLPYKYYSEYGIQKFGFHGISHQYCMESILSRHKGSRRIISIHLGTGASICAIKNGKPIDTSMGFTPLSGLMMMTRSGDMDAGIIHYLIEKGYLKHREVDSVLNNDSGMVGISGFKTDMLNLLYIAGYKVEERGFNPEFDRNQIDNKVVDRVRLAFDMYVYRVKKYIGQYYSVLGGLDVLSFTGKIGYGSEIVRSMILKDLDHITKDAIIEAIQTNEELQIAKKIAQLIK